MSPDDYTAYLARHAEVGGRRKRLDGPGFERLRREYERLLATMDPADIQLDEWKRIEELRFLLILEDADEETS